LQILRTGKAITPLRFCDRLSITDRFCSEFFRTAASTALANGRAMARRRRLFIPGLAQHVIQRGINRADIFHVPGDRDVFLSILHDALSRFSLEVHAYVLMTNHLHMMATPGDARALPNVMQALGRSYVPYFNKRYERTGGLFNGRYKAFVVDDERYWFTCMRYIELNPVRAGLVQSPDEYPWSSFHANAQGIPDFVVTPHQLYTRLGQTSSKRQCSWRGVCGAALADDELTEIRSAVAKSRLPARVVFPDTAGV